VFCPGTLGPYCWWPGPHTGGSGSHSRGPVRTRGGPRPNLEVQTVYPGVRHFPMGSGLTVDALEYITFSGHVAAPDPPMWWGQTLLLTESCRPRLGRVMAWSHIQLFYHTTKSSHVGTMLLYSSKGYLSFRVWRNRPNYSSLSAQLTPLRAATHLNRNNPSVPRI
jgi:hypothetical protein